MASVNGKMRAASLRKTVLYVVFALLLLLAVMFFVAGSVGELNAAVMIILGIVSLVAAIAVLLYARKLDRMMKLFRQYVSIMNQYPDGRIDELARHTGESDAVTLNNLNFMINQNWFVNAFINRDTNCLVITRANPESNIDADHNEYVSCTCPACGGVSKVIRGKSGKCDFCGGSIRG